eukprot:658958-Pleurochrysis_carterae.AAC.1
MPPERWSRDRVFDSVQRWVYDDKSKAADFKREWSALQTWQLAYSSPEAVLAGVVHRVGEGLDIGGAPSFSWKQLWTLLDSRAPGAGDDASAVAASSAPAAAIAQPAAGTSMRGNARREHLSSSHVLSELNVVSHPGYTDRDARLA